MRRKVFAGFLVLMVLLIDAQLAYGVSIGDIVRTKGSESNQITGMGLVVGLNGTGGTTPTELRLLASLLGPNGDALVTAQELEDVNNVAVVYLTATIPASGCREGDRFDVQVATTGSASSLAGGNLVYAMLKNEHDPAGPPIAYASGKVDITSEDEPNTGIIHANANGGAKIVRDVNTQLLDARGRVQLVLDQSHASYQNAHLVASMINEVYALEQMPDIAKAIDQKTIQVDVPVWERENPVRFIQPILDQQLPEDQLIGKARVYVNKTDGTIVVTGNVRIVPTVITHEGMQIELIEPPIEPTPVTPRITQQSFQAMDPSGIGGNALDDLVKAMNLLGLDPDAKVEIIEALHKAGAFHASVVIEG